MKMPLLLRRKLVFGFLIAAVLFLSASGITLYTIRTTLDNLIYRSGGDEIRNKTPADLGLPYTEVEFTGSTGLQIRGWLVGGETRSCILLCPGKGANRWDVLSYAPFLYHAGYSVLLFDPRSTGLSQGEKYGLGYFKSRDMIHAANYLNAAYQIEHIGILGFSAGGTAAILAAIEEPLIRAVVADSAFASLEIAATSSMSSLQKYSFRAVLPLFRREAARKLGVNVFKELDLTEKIRRLEKPVLFIHGTRDQVILPSNSRRLYSLAPGPKEIWLVPGAGHVGAFFEHPHRFEETVLDFFDRNLGK
ncbi:MAG: alpha/beta fold hydrolase [Desulfosalsimonas sp.]